MPPDRIKTSFIPKASLKIERRETSTKAPLALASSAAALILIVAILAAVGLFLYEQFTVQNIARKRESLDRARAAFQPATIKELARVDTRLATGAALLGAHLAPSIVFDEIEARTLTSVRFNDFTLGETGTGRMSVSMSGIARSFNAVALQSDTFGDSEFFEEPIFSNLNIDQAGNVVFDFSAFVNRAELAYRASGAAPVAPTPETPQPTP